jgi:hypothetical protein
MRKSLPVRVRGALLAAAAVAVVQCSAGARTTPSQGSVAKVNGPVVLQKGPVFVPLNNPDTGGLLTHDALEKRAGGGRLTLVLSNISAEDQPGSPFAVYVGLAPNAEPVKNDPHYVGRFSFFNEINAGALKATPSSRTFDVGAVLQRLRSAGTLNAPIGITIVPEREPAGEVRATIGSIELRSS